MSSRISTQPLHYRSGDEETALTSVDLKYCTEPPHCYYQLEESQEYLFQINPDVAHGVGYDDYIAVSMETGKVRHIGRHGE